MVSEKLSEAVGAQADGVDTSPVPAGVGNDTQEGDEELRQWTAEGPLIIDADTNKRLFWKVNRRILVVMLVTYFCQSLDKGTLNFSSIMGIQQDANLHGQQVITIPKCLSPITANLAVLGSIHGLVPSCTWASSSESIHKTSYCRSFLWPNSLLPSMMYLQMAFS